MKRSKKKSQHLEKAIFMYTRIMEMFIVRVLVWATTHQDDITTLCFLVSWRVYNGVGGAGALLFRALALGINPQHAFVGLLVVYIDRVQCYQTFFFFARNCEMCRCGFVACPLLIGI